MMSNLEAALLGLVIGSTLVGGVALLVWVMW